MFRDDNHARGDRPNRPHRNFGGSHPRRPFEGENEERPRRPFRKIDKEGEERPRRSFGGDRPYRKFEGDREERPHRNFGSDRPYRKFEREDEERPRRNFGGDRPYRKFENDGEERPRRSFDRPRRQFDGEGEERPRRNFGSDRPRRQFNREEERPRRSFGGERPARRTPAWKRPEEHTPRRETPDTGAHQALEARKVASQLNALHDAARDVLAGVFGQKMPPDLLLAERFRNNHQCGSRDRALISSGVYALMRYWGFLRKLMPHETARQVEKGEIHFSHRELGSLLYAALFCDAPDSDALGALASNYDLPKLPRPAPESLIDRARAAAALFTAKTELHLDDLLPAWIAARVPDGSAVAAALGKRPPLWIRIHRDYDKCLAEFNAKNLPFQVFENLPGAVALFAPRINLFTLDGYADGCFEVQDLASQAIGSVCDVHPGMRVLDACAGAGGKTLQLASLMHNKGVIIAGDVRENKLEELRRRARRAGVFNIHTRPHTGKLWRDFKPADRVLLDVPCSGSGVWRRNPGLQWCFTEETLKEHVALQQEILEHFASAVKPGGKLIYSTCSLFPEENELQIQSFLERHPEFTLAALPHPLTGRTAEGICRFAPAENQCDCDFMFAAVLERSARE